MKVKEITETREVVVRTEYVAEDGEVFRDKEECKKYEDSAMFVVSKKLKRLTKEHAITHNDIHDDCSCDEDVEIFDVQTKEDLENLRKYLYLKMRKNGVSEQNLKECFTSNDGERRNFVFDAVTYGHEVMIFWSYDNDWFWVYGDGSINGYVEYYRNRIKKLIAPETEIKEDK